MSQSTRILPEEFASLEPHASWALASEQQRSARRQASAFAEIQQFYDAMLPQMDRILSFLERYPVRDVPDDVSKLFYMTLSMAEIAPAVENFGQPQVVDGYDVARFIPVDLYPPATGKAHQS